MEKEVFNFAFNFDVQVHPAFYEVEFPEAVICEALLPHASLH